MKKVNRNKNAKAVKTTSSVRIVRQIGCVVVINSSSKIKDVAYHEKRVFSTSKAKRNVESIRFIEYLKSIKFDLTKIPKVVYIVYPDLEGKVHKK